MTEVLGPRNLLDSIFPVSGLDTAEIYRVSVLGDKKTVGELLREMAVAVGAMNQELVSIYGSLMYITEDPKVEYAAGDNAAGMLDRAGEWTTPDMRRAGIIGHMLPLWEFDGALAWSYKWLKHASETQTAVDLNLLQERWRNTFDYYIVRRMLTDDEEAVGSAGTGYSVGWAIGSGTNVNFIPPAYMGTTFTSSHTHYLGETSFPNAFEALIKTIREHGIGYGERPVALVSDDDIDTIMALSNFVEFLPPEIQYNAVSGAPVMYTRRAEYQGVPGEIFGYYKSSYGLIELRSHWRFPTNYVYMTFPKGQLNPNNGIRIRVDKGGGFGLTVDPQIDRSVNPRLAQVLVNTSFGVGVGNRLNGAACFVDAGGSWVDATIS